MVDSQAIVIPFLRFVSRWLGINLGGEPGHVEDTNSRCKVQGYCLKGLKAVQEHIETLQIIEAFAVASR